MVQCPSCDVPMREASVRANPGTLIILDQCRKCGGIWCDKWELFPVEAEDARRLESLDEKLLQSPVRTGKKTLYCPRCTGRLQVFNDPLLPPETQLQRCRRCEGIWLNRGQLSRFKEFQKKRRQEKLPSEARTRTLVEAYQNPASWVTIGTGGIFAYPRGEPENSAADAITFGGTFKLILHALLQLVFRL